MAYELVTPLIVENFDSVVSRLCDESKEVHEAHAVVFKDVWNSMFGVHTLIKVGPHMKGTNITTDAHGIHVVLTQQSIPKRGFCKNALLLLKTRVNDANDALWTHVERNLPSGSWLLEPMAVGVKVTRMDGPGKGMVIKFSPAVRVTGVVPMLTPFCVPHPTALGMWHVTSPRMTKDWFLNAELRLPGLLSCIRFLRWFKGAMKWKVRSSCFVSMCDSTEPYFVSAWTTQPNHWRKLQLLCVVLMNRIETLRGVDDVLKRHLWDAHKDLCELYYVLDLAK